MATTEQETPAGAAGAGDTGRANRVLVVVLGSVAVIAIVAAVLAATREAPTYDRDTPEGVVQAYVAALINGENEDAARFLAPENSCDVSDLDQAYLPEEVRVVLLETEVAADTATVDVEVVMVADDLFGAEEYAEEHTFRLTENGGEWLITGQPWPVYHCVEED